MRERSKKHRSRAVAVATHDQGLLWRALLITSLLLLAAGQLLAQSRRIPFDHLTTEEGLSHDSVNVTIQEDWYWYYLGSAKVVKVSGDAIRERR